MAATAKPDGYTIAQIPITVIRLPLMQKTAWDAVKDFTYIVHLTGYAFGVTTKADGPFKTWADVVDFAKANPGKVTYATPGAGTSLHIGMEQIAAKAGIKLTHVPFKGDAEKQCGRARRPHHAAGGRQRLEAAGRRRHSCGCSTIWTDKRSKNWPDVPTLKELGYPVRVRLPVRHRRPEGHGPEAVQVLHDAFKKALEDPEMLAVLDKFLMVPNYANQKGYLEIIKQTTAYEKQALERIRACREVPRWGIGPDHGFEKYLRERLKLRTWDTLAGVKAGHNRRKRMRLRNFVTACIGGCRRPGRAHRSRGADLSDQADHHDRALAGRRLDRRRHARHCGGRRQASRPADHHRQQGRRLRHARARRRWPPRPSPTATRSRRCRSRSCACR